MVPVAPELAMRLRTWSFAWPRRTAIGATGGSRARWPIRATRSRAAGFFTFEVWTRSGLTRFVVLLRIDVSTRQVEIAGIGSKADGIWMGQLARNLRDDGDGFLTATRCSPRSFLERWPPVG